MGQVPELMFRDAKRDDLAVIMALIIGGIPEGFDRPEVDGSHPDMLAAFETITASPDHRLIVAERDGAVVGTMQISYLPGLARNGMWRGLLESVHVKQSLRGQGIGRQMVEWAIAQCKAHGCGMVQLTSNKVRKDAHRFYERLGFERSHEGFKLML